MANFFINNFGDFLLINDSQATGAISLTVTDGDLSVSFARGSGFGLAREGWSMPSAPYKSGGIFGNSAMAHGQVLKHAVFDNVIDEFSFALHFNTTNNLLAQIDELEELLTVRAVEYWTGRRTTPVWLERSLDGETNTGYYLINHGRVITPEAIVSPWLLNIGHLQPVQVLINRQPFTLGAAPGSTQKRPSIYALQSWNFQAAWAEEDTTPSGQVYSFVELGNGDIYAGGASEILFYDESAGTWAAATTTPVTLAGDITAALLLDNGDILFGDNGQIVKLDSGGTWSVESSLPSGQVWAIAATNVNTLYAADNAQILKRDTNGTWAVDSTTPAGQVYSLVHASSGRTFAGGAGEILRTVNPSTTTELKVRVSQGSDDAEQAGSSMTLTGDLDFFDSANNWIGLRFQNVTIPAGATITSAVVRFKAEDTDTGTSGATNIYCEDTDSANTFTTASNNISGRTLTTAFTSWSSVAAWSKNNNYDTPDFSAAVQEVVDRAGWSSGNNLAVIFDMTASGADRDAYSYDQNSGDAPQLVVTYATATAATSWEVVSTAPAGNVSSAVEVGGIVLFGDSGQILSTDDDGDSFGVVDSSTPTGTVTALEASGTTVYAGDNGNILKSSDGGLNWSVDSTLPTAQVYALLISTGTTRAGDNGRILALTSTDFDLGQEATTTGDVMLANHHKQANLTDILNDDGGVFTGIFPASSFPLTLFPATAAANDNVYFGCDTSITDSGPFSSLVFDLATVASATTSYTITWEYWNGSSWGTLTTQDGTSQLSAVGVNVVAWEIPSNWATTSVNSITGYWVRARLSALTGTFTNPTQQTRDIYTASTPYLEIASTATAGTIDSLARLQARNRSADSGGSVALTTNRLMCGVKPVSGYESFRAFLNFADEQNPSGVSVAVSVDGDSASSFVTSTSAATGRAVFFDAGLATLNSMEDRIAITLNTTVAADYYGSYKAFVRGQQSGGSAGEVRLRLKVVTGSGGISFLTDTQATKAVADHLLIEFDDIINIPVSSQFTAAEVGDETSITLQIEATQSDADFYAYDLFLLPTDRHYVDAIDAANTSASGVGNGERVTIDSIGVPKANVRGKAEKSATGAVKATYEVISDGPFQVMSKTQQRLWFLAAQYQSAGTAVWVSKPETVHSARIWVTDRWLTGRGES